MEKNVKHSRFKSIPAWALSLMIALLSFILVFLIAHLADLLGFPDEGSGGIVAYIIYAVIVAFATYCICKNFPGSIWYTPVVCNIMGIIAAIIEPSFWVSEMWIIIGSGWILSATGALIGFLQGRSISQEEKV